MTKLKELRQQHKYYKKKVEEIERDRGKPLSKYDRNVMIFDWLHTLDESATIVSADVT